MSVGAFRPGFEELPRVVPIFPLPGVLLLPGGRIRVWAEGTVGSEGPDLFTPASTGNLES